MLYAFIVTHILISCKGTALFFLRKLLFLDRRADFTQKHFGNVAGGSSQTGNGIQRIEVDNTLKILKNQIFVGGIAAAD
ncbi:MULTISPECIES: hypothetical protein [unclassified Dehalobacter]|uniref:hypothetical protein n=1 Tax=unclassified Dehalobacter TaxID=2635733 RepID=UPI0009DA94FD|nr:MULTISPECIES: hypothetical protein [unclassified Dehalobacter]